MPTAKSLLAALVRSEESGVTIPPPLVLVAEDKANALHR